MGTTRQKKVVLSNISREMAEEAFAAYNSSLAKLGTVEGEMNIELTAVRQKYDDQISKLQAERDKQFEILNVYASENPELFEKRKSIEWTHGIMGFRTGTPKLKTLKGFTWESVKVLVKKMMPDYIRIAEEVAKDSLLANRKDLGDKLKNIGVEVVQDETFYVEPALDEVATA